ncbi:MAG: c-type cytochrome [Microthrixaceae bacterium]|nr:c-type cytochrome [Microthrixaceae bacterium]
MKRPNLIFAATTGLLILTAVGVGIGCTSSNGDTSGQSSETTMSAAEARTVARSGGDATVTNTGANAFGQPVSGLSKDDLRAFVVGNNFFNDNWVTAPASTTGRDGLGPLFNAQACSSCHFKDGRGSPPTDENPTAKGLLIRMSIPGEDSTTGAPLPDPVYGGQFQDNAITGVPAEGTLSITPEPIKGKFADGTPYSLANPVYNFTDLGYGPFHPQTMLSPRVGNAVFGTGLLEAIPEETIRGFADPDDSDGDGISGRVNEVWSSEFNKTMLGRFGWKANVASVKEQVAGAFRGDIGMTSSLIPTQDCMPAQTECLAAPTGGEPELDDKKLDRVTFYTRTLAVPARRDVTDKSVQRGEQQFIGLGCNACHKSNIRTGKAEPAQLSEQTISPYTDMLLHDMGPGLADDRPDFLASGSEWRTAPLWGIGLTKTVNRHTRFLHDGRARNLTEAILWHGGEAESAKAGFVKLDSKSRNDLIKFLESL